MASSSVAKKRRVNSEIFVEAIRPFKFLYDLQNKDYKDKLMKENRWKLIGDQFGLTGEESYEKWKGLRDRYMRERKQYYLRKKSGDGLEDTVKPKWALYEILKGFLEHKNSERGTSSNMLESSDEEDNCTRNQPVTIMSERDNADTPNQTSIDLHRDDANALFRSIEDYTDIDDDLENNNSRLSTSASGSTSSNKSLIRTSAALITDNNKNQSSKKRKADDNSPNPAVMSLLEKATKNLSEIVPASTHDEHFHYFRSLETKFRELPKEDQIDVRYRFEQILHEVMTKTLI